VSNIPVVLPTVRAERFWYFPVIGSAVVVAIVMAKLHKALKSRGVGYLSAGVVVVYLGFQSLAARLHANDYTNDLVFWDATRRAVPNSAKAHLNYSVMLGARQDLPGRLESNKVALRLAPKWPMASVYLGDTLCRMHRAPEAMQYYLVGFDLAPNDMNLIALGVQCLWDEKMLGSENEARSDLQALADKHQGSWLKYIVDDTIASGEENHGVNPKYRPRGYNEGPKGE
jgi:tetratricopeptide (TPR) repeat protein